MKTGIKHKVRHCHRRIRETSLRPTKISEGIVRTRFRVAVVSLLAILVMFAIAFVDNAQAHTIPPLVRKEPVVEKKIQAPARTDENKSATKTKPRSDEWNLILVNYNHPVKDLRFTLTQFGNGQQVDARCYPDLDRLIEAARSAGYQPEVFSSYRSREYQAMLLDNSIRSLIASGWTEAAARREATRYIAEPGTSEHETGLAVDMTSQGDVASYQTEDLPIYAWLADHSWEYGWIRRYPREKETITHIAYEPWHFRYVGEKAAREMHERGICLEEYLKV